MPSTRSLSIELGCQNDNVFFVTRRAIGRDAHDLTNEEAVQVLRWMRTNRRSWPRQNRPFDFYGRLATVIRRLQGMVAASEAIPELAPQPEPVQRRQEPVQVGVGADPEFQVVNAQGNVVRFRGDGPGAEVGNDGDISGIDNTGELRPHSDADPLKVYETIDGLISRVDQKVARGHRVVAGEGKHVPVGGHIHISGVGTNPSPTLITALDKFLYHPLKTVCDGYRRRSSYDRAGQCRPQAYPGGATGFEYRSAPSWLAHPILTKGALVIAVVMCRNHRTIPVNEDALADMAQNAEERAAIDGFYAFIAALMAKGIKLESLDVLKTWAKRHEAPGRRTRASVTEDTVVPLPVTDFPVRTSNDENLPQDMRHPVGANYVFVGAGAHRGSMVLERILVPMHFPTAQLEALDDEFGYGNTQRWELSTIGIGIGFRDTEAHCRETIQRILRVIAPVL